MSSGADELSLADAIDGLLVFVTGPVLGATMCPGIFLCLPGLALVIVPIAVLGTAAILLGAIAATPFLLARGAVRMLRRPG